METGAEQSQQQGATQTQTQQEVKNLYTDIFGDSDDEDDGPLTQKSSAVVATVATSSAVINDDDDNLFDSDDEEGDGAQKSVAKANAALAEENLIDSDDEEIKKSKSSATKKKSKRGREDGDTSSKKKKKRSQSEGTEGRKKRTRPPISGEATRRDAEKSADGNESGDSYDSGEDVGANADDKRFIDEEDDEFADLVKEYEHDNENFDDERPDGDGYKTSKSKSKSSSYSSSSSGAMGRTSFAGKESDPLTETLATMKRPKAAQMADADKEIFVEKFQRKMEYAAKQDDLLFSKKKPAVNKLQLLSMFRQVMGMRFLHHTMLERDILGNLRDWIEPRDAKTLPALSVRTAVYNALLQLNCLPDHLKRTTNEKPPIGVTIVSLRKHKMETPENKRLLKEIMEKWSRPIFSKSLDIRSAGMSGAATARLEDNAEVQAALRQKYAAERDSSSRSGSSSRMIGSLLSGTDPNAADSTKVGDRSKASVRVPLSSGFLFTVQPELHQIDKRDLMEKSLGEGRMKLFKKMNEIKNGSKFATGRKSNPRAMDMSLTKTSKNF